MTDEEGDRENAALTDRRFRAGSDADGDSAGSDADGDSAGSDADGDSAGSEGPNADSVASEREDADSAASEGAAASEADPVELGVQLLERLEDAELSMAELMDRVETVSTHPRVVRAVIEAAEERGVVERDGATVRPRGGGYVRFGADVVTKEGEFSCRRCGTGLSEGHFIRLDGGEVGPFGSSCIRKVTGRE